MKEPPQEPRLWRIRDACSFLGIKRERLEELIIDREMSVLPGPNCSRLLRDEEVRRLKDDFENFKK
jgi:hypothetical protein